MRWGRPGCTVVERGALGDSIGREGEGTGGGVGKAWGARGGEGGEDASGEVEDNLDSPVDQN